METLTIQKQTYIEMIDTEIQNMRLIAELTGTITALSNIIKDNPSFVQDQLKTLSEQLQKINK